MKCENCEGDLTEDNDLLICETEDCRQRHTAKGILIEDFDNDFKRIIGGWKQGWMDDTHLVREMAFLYSKYKRELTAE